MNQIRILLVDDHRIVREGLISMLSMQSDMLIVGEAATGSEVIPLVERLRPTIVLLDLEMPGLDGVSVLEKLHPAFPTVRVIILTAYGSDERILDAVRAGARGYLLKSASLSEVLNAIRIVAGGGSLLEPNITERLLDSMERMLRSGKIPMALTERERAILTLIARGLPNKAIGIELGIAERTVKFHATIIFQKLGVSNRVEAVAKALHDHLISL